MPPERLRTELAAHAPAELLYPKSFKEELTPLFRTLPDTVVTPLDEWLFEEQFARDLLVQHFRVANLKGYGIDDIPMAIAAAGAALHYLKLSQLGAADQVTGIHRGHPERSMLLDRSTIRHLELVEPGETGNSSSLFQILDKCQTPMGSRLLRRRLLAPLLSVADINRRLEQVSTFLTDDLRSQIRDSLSSIGDLHRAAGRLAAGRGNPREAGVVRQALNRTPAIFEMLSDCDSFTGLQRIDTCRELAELLERAINDRLPLSLTEGGGDSRSLQYRFGSASLSFRKRTRGINRLSNEGTRAVGNSKFTRRLQPGLRVLYRNIESSIDCRSRRLSPYSIARKCRTIQTEELQQFEDEVLNAEDKAIELKCNYSAKSVRKSLRRILGC